MEHNPSAWRIGWDMNLLAAAYSVILISLFFIYSIYKYIDIQYIYIYILTVKLSNLVNKVMDHLVDYHYLPFEINSMDLFNGL